jgi:hypothetical protein
MWCSQERPLLLLDDPLVDTDGLDIRFVLDCHNHVHGVPVVHVFPHLQTSKDYNNYISGFQAGKKIHKTVKNLFQLFYTLTHCTQFVLVSAKRLRGFFRVEACV